MRYAESANASYAYMTPKRWQQVEKLYHSALNREPAQRRAFLKEACVGDEGLRQEVESLLAHQGEAEGFIEEPALEVAAKGIADNSTQSLVGLRIGSYKILSLLGVGGMGEVYLAQDPRLERTVALKILPAELACDPERMRRFVREARAASALKHPNVATIHEMGESDGIHFIAMEYVEGQTLVSKISGRPLKNAEIVEIALQVADALDEAHAKGITHRDIKSANIMLTPRGQAKVLDFGLAKITRPEGQAASGDLNPVVTTETGLVMGTVHYMSPEQVLGRKVDGRTDIFSLGVVLYEMATGRLPFSGASASETMDRILHAPPEAIARFNYNLPIELERIVRKCLEKDLDRRYQSARDLLIDLRNLRENCQEGALVEKSSAETARPVPRAIGLRWPVTLVAAGFVLAAVLAFWLGTPLPSPKVSGYTQITADGRRKLNTLVTDGSRLYFSELVDTQWVLCQVSSLGGETTPIPTPFPNVGVLSISPNRSELLISILSSPALQHTLWVLPIVSGSPRRLDPILAHDAAWSPDGQWIAYTKGSELCLAKNDGTESHTIVKAAGQAQWARWSPNGKRLRFTVSDTKTASTSLWEVVADGSDLHPLLAGWNQPPRECRGSWTADGKYFVFQSSRGEETNIWAIREKPGLLHKPGHEPVQLTYAPMNFVAPTPGLDGNKVFAVSEHLRGELLRHDSKKQEFVSYLSGISAGGLDFSQDGEWVAYVTYPAWNLWRCKSDGSQRLQLSFRGLKVGVSPGWSPDGKRIAFAACTAGGPWKIYVVSVEGGSPEQLLLEDQNEEYDPCWSPDGNTIVFGSGNRNLPTRAIQLLDLRTHDLSKLPDSEGLFYPRWSPDGRYIAALPSDEHELLLFDLKTQKWQELAKGEIAYPRWSRDGEYIYFVSFLPNDPALLRVRIRNRKLEQLASLKDFRLIPTGGMGLTPDSSPLLTRDMSTREIYALDLQAP